MPDSDYIFLGDSDGGTIDSKRAKLLEHYKSLSREKTFVCEYEIESWYFAGLSQENAKKLKIKHWYVDTNRLTKQQFDNLLPTRSNRLAIMTEMLKLYNISLAVTRNYSLKLFEEAI